MNIEEYLKDQGVEFEVIEHEQAFTAQEVAAAEHVTGHKFAKPVIADGAEGSYMLVVPASRHVDFDKASELAGETLEMADEGEMKKLFPDCEVGAEPPFGEEYGLDTFVDTTLAERDEIVFRAGTHDRTIKMSYQDYADIEQPTVGDIAMPEE